MEMLSELIKIGFQPLKKGTVLFIGKNCRVIRIEVITEFVDVCQMSEEEYKEG